MSFEIRSPSDPGSEPPKSDFYVTLDVLRRIYNFFKDTFSFLNPVNLKFFQVSRKAIGAPPKRTDFDQVVHYVKHKVAVDSKEANRFFLLDRLQAPQLTAAEERRLKNLGREIPGDILIIAKKLTVDLSSPVEITRMELKPVIDEMGERAGEQLDLVIRREGDVPYVVVVGAEKFELGQAEAVMLPEILKDALEVFNITASVQEV